jgi:hypothetical protein
MALIRGLLDRATPQTYEQIFGRIDRSQVVLVSGEQDNVYVPGFEDGGEEPEPPASWAGLTDAGTVTDGAEQRYETPTLAAGTYSFEITGTNDADLYVRVGAAPTQQVFDCRPFKTGSRETCRVDISTPAPVHVMVRGWAASSDFELTGTKLD